MAIDAKNITRLDLEDIYTELKEKTAYHIQGQRGMSIDDHAITDAEINSQSKIVFRMSMTAMALIADKTRRLKVHNQSSIDALSYYDDLEDPDDNLNADGTVTDPDGNDIDPDTFIVNEKMETGEKFDPTTGDTIEFSIDGLEDNYRYTIVMEFLKEAIVKHVLWKWWEMKINPDLPQIAAWAAASERDFREAITHSRANSVFGHRHRTTKLKPRSLG